MIATLLHLLALPFCVLGAWAHYREDSDLWGAFFGSALIWNVLAVLP